MRLQHQCYITGQERQEDVLDSEVDKFDLACLKIKKSEKPARDSRQHRMFSLIKSIIPGSGSIHARRPEEAATGAH
jgi:hypothetical protein